MDHVQRKKIRRFDKQAPERRGRVMNSLRQASMPFLKSTGLVAAHRLARKLR
ncbi:MAG TPA: hypothetical protein VG166_08975 [Caulobacteraceae bacterium]|nr:hypothetical protein [Caulobacteraceae bacterium]